MTAVCSVGQRKEWISNPLLANCGGRIRAGDGEADRQEYEAIHKGRRRPTDCYERRMRANVLNEGVTRHAIGRKTDSRDSEEGVARWLRCAQNGDARATPHLLVIYG